MPENRHSEKSWEAYVDTSSQYDESDPALAELEFAMDQAQFTHLQALEDSVNEAAWGAHLAAYAPGSDATDGSGGGIIEPGFGTTTSPEAAARTRRQEVALNRLIQKVKREAREREENLEKRAAAAATYVQRDTVAGSHTVGDRADGDESADTSNEITPTSWWERRQLGGYSSEFEGYGYGTTISQLALAKAFTASEGPRLHLSDEKPVASFDWWRGGPSTWHSKRLHNVMPFRRQVSRVTAVVELAMVHKFPLHFQHPSASPKRYIQR